MKIDKETIARVSRLARLSLTPREEESYAEKISDIITYVEKINELDTASVEPADHIDDLKNVFREDIPGESLARELVEKTAPRFEDGHFVVPRVIDDQG